MSEIKFPCIHCGQRLSCEPVLIGQRITCPACQRSVLVPWAPVEQGPSRSSVASPGISPPASAEGAELPRVSIPQLSLPDTEEATARPAPKVLQLQGRNRLASGYSKLAIVSFVIAFLGPVGFLPAIVCAHLAKWQMRRNPGIRGESLATAALAIGYTSGLLTGVFAARNLLRKL